MPDMRCAVGVGDRSRHIERRLAHVQHHLRVLVVSRNRPAPPPPEPLAPLVDAHTHLDACGARTATDVRAILDRAEAVGVQAAA